MHRGTEVEKGVKMRDLVYGSIVAVVVATLAAAPATALAQGQAPKLATVLALEAAA